jgi:Na+:H+ antiporter, NhaA family
MTNSHRQPIERISGPLREFTDNAAAGGVVLVIAAIVAFVWANSPWADSYVALWETTFTVGIGDSVLSTSLHHWINDGLMAIFFLVVGLEIKREVLVGELATIRRAVLPITAAAGGAILPAAIFLAFNLGGPGERGWGIPMATDIAFTLGVLALIGSRAPLGLKLFLTALAIADDLLAVVVIAVFYTDDLRLEAILGAAIMLGLLLGANRLGIQRPMVYAVLGIGLWLMVLQSGVHATVAGVLLAFFIPSRVPVDSEGFRVLARRSVAEYERALDNGGGEPARNAALWDLEAAVGRAQSPMQRIEHALGPWVAFAIVPVFALANAGVRIVDANPIELILQPIPIGIILGLVVGKQVGITLATWLVVRSGVAELPRGVSMRHIFGVAWLGGIGFTMSLFIAELAFAESTALLDGAKIGILVASLVAGTGGFVILRYLSGDASSSGDQAHAGAARGH